MTLCLSRCFFFLFTEIKDAALMFTKRGVAEFTLMGLCYLGLERHPHEYLGYGCYCGIGGKGEPLDETDRCSKGALFVTSYIYINPSYLDRALFRPLGPEERGGGGGGGGG